MDELRSEIRAAFSVDVRSIQAVSGGDIAKAFRIGTPEGPLFAKIMSGSQGAAVLASEARNLKAIRDNGALRTPEIYGLEKLSEGSCLLMAYVAPGEQTRPAMEALGRGLAYMHKTTHAHFGWEADNFIGPLPQQNHLSDDWAAFYTEQRLLPLFGMAAEKGLLNGSRIPSEARVEQRIRDGIPKVAPCLLHGDLWGGNYLISEDETPFLIDPASYFGHHEVDLAITRLFGGFSEAFYAAYREILPDSPGWQKRVKLYQLYYLLVHLVLFGSSYAPAVRSHSEAWFRD